MVGHGGSSAGSYLADPTSPIPSHCASIVATSTLRVNIHGIRPHSSVCLILPVLPGTQTTKREAVWGDMSMINNGNQTYDH